MAWCRKKEQQVLPAQPYTGSLTDASRWSWQSSPGMPSGPEPHPEGFQFVLPKLPASAHYLVTGGFNRPLADVLQADVEFVFDGEPALVAKDPDDTPPCFTAMLWMSS